MAAGFFPLHRAPCDVNSFLDFRHLPHHVCASLCVSAAKKKYLTADGSRHLPGGHGRLKPASPPGNREKLSDRIYRIVQDLFFFRKALMKNM
jgi:hypothetical protein